VAEVINVNIQLGSWIEPKEVRQSRLLFQMTLPGALEKDIPSDRDLVQELRRLGLDPWHTDTTKSRYFANASAESFLFLVGAYQLVGPLLLDGSAREVGRLLVETLFTWMGKRFTAAGNSVTLEQAFEGVRQHFISVHRTAPDDVEELSAEQFDDGYDFIVRSRTTGKTYYFRTIKTGRIVATLNVNELETCRRVTREIEQSREPR
jgi:hypothetical protein